MTELLGVDYDVLALDMTESESRQRALVSEPTPPSTPPALPEPEAIARPPADTAPPAARPTATPSTGESDAEASHSDAVSPATDGDRLQEHIVSPAPTTERLESIQRMVADQLGDALPPDFSANVLQSIPVQAGGLYPISDIWHIDPGLDAPGRLRVHIAQFAREIAGEVDLDACVEDRSDGIGFACRAPTQVSSPLARAVLALLVSLAGQQSADVGLDGGHFVTDLPALLHGQGNVMPTGPGDERTPRWSAVSSAAAGPAPAGSGSRALGPGT